MVHWIYIFRCKNNTFYVGETTRLYRRFWEHDDGECKNTRIFTPIGLEAIYKSDNMGNFFNYNERILSIDENLNTYHIGFWNPKYLFDNWSDITERGDHLQTETNVADCIKINRKGCNVRGGKYTRFGAKYSKPDDYFIKHLPMCSCGLPCDVKKKDDYLYFRCPKKNFWDDMYQKFEIIGEPCDYFQKYTKDFKIRNSYQNFVNQKTKITLSKQRLSKIRKNLK